MKMTYQGIQRIQGYKKANGEPFDMTVCYVGVPIESGAFGKTDKKTVITGFGNKTAEVEADHDCIPQFKDIKPGETVELVTDQRFFMGEFRTVIVGVKRLPAAVAPVARAG